MIKIISFFKSIPLMVYGGVAALLLLGATVAYCNHQVEERVEVAEEVGAVKEQNKQIEQTLKNVETAEQAREEITKPGPVGDLTRYNQCVQSARTPENCKRFLPSVQKVDD